MKGYRISLQQKRLWLLQQESPAYCAQCAILIEGDLHARSLKTSLEKVIARHEILRTTFYRPHGMKFPFQVIADKGASSWREIDLRGVRPDQQEPRLEELLQEEWGRPFDFEGGPLFRLSLLALSADRHALLITLPSLCADARTCGNLTREIVHFYSACFHHQQPLEAPLQYVDYAEWQRELSEMEDADAAKGREYWSRQNISPLPELKLPFEGEPDSAAGIEPGSFSQTTSLKMDADLVAQLEAAAQKSGTTAEVFLLACWQTLLWRLTGEPDILTSHVRDGRRDGGLQEAFGGFARNLPVKSHFADASSFSEILSQVNEAARNGYEWQDYRAWEDLPGDATVGTDSPFGFEFAEWPAPNYAVGVSFTIHKQRSVIQQFKLLLSCARAGASLTVAAHYDPARYEREYIERLVRHFATLVGSAASDPDAMAGELDLLGPDDRQRLLLEFNQTAADYPRDQCIHQLFEQQAARTPNRMAVVCRGRRLTYAELNAQANQLARHLRQRGVGAGARVGLCVDRSVEMIVGILAILKAGAAYVPLNAEYPRARLAGQLEEIAAPVALTQESLMEKLPEFAGEAFCLDRDRWLWAEEPETDLECVTGPEDPVYVIYTSGSTGAPKGVEVRHRGLVNYTHYICQRLRLADAENAGGLQFATVSTITADLGNTCVYPSLVSGGCLHVMTYETATDGRLMASYVAEHPIDVLKIVPSHLNALLASQPAGMSILPRKYLISGGEALSRELVERIAAQVASCEVINHYGPTETTVGSLTANVGENRTVRSGTATIPIGRPIANTEVYILDRHLKPVPIGVAGELYIGGAGLAEGYLNQPDRTAERFVRNPYSNNPDARFYKTGDLARYLPDGQVEFLGRTDNQVKIRGYRVELEEIEVVLGQHPSVRQAVVIAREEEAGRKRLVGYVVGKNGNVPSASELQSYVSERLPDYMAPSTIVTLESLPLTANGKVDRKALPAPDQARSERESEYVAPRTPTEELLANIWAQVLGVEKVGIHDNFFSVLGGDSILSIQIIARANQAGLRLIPRNIFERQTVAGLAEVAGGVAAIESEQGLVTGDAPLTPIQRWFFERNFTDPHHWNQALLFETRQALEPALLEMVTRRLLVHHDALRLRFVDADSRWRQFNSGLEGPAPFAHLDLSPLSEAEQKTAVEVAAAALQASMNLSEGPLLRVAFFDRGKEKPGRLLIAIHHLAVDGVSWRILLEDLHTGYQQLSSGAEMRLPPKTTSFKRWAERLEEYAQSDALRQEAAYWLAESSKRARRLPVDYPGGANTVDSSATVTVSLSPDETRALLHQAPEAYRTQINEVLLTALAQGLARWTGARSLLIDMEGHGREEIIEDVDLWRTVGWFTTHFPVLLDLGTSGDPGAALKVIKERLRAVPNRGIGYGVLRYLGREEEIAERLRAAPQPEVSFNYLGQFDQALPETSPFRPASESIGPLQSLRGERSHLLYFSGNVAGGQMRLTCIYSRNLYRRATIEELTGNIAEALRSIITHCQSAEAGGFTPSDFALARLDERKLDRISSLLNEIDDLQEEE
jgi:amino acid adenylation domain-containing protein/non-ribosomal peptide synthase protein (TIGR01720 family)